MSKIIPHGRYKSDINSSLLRYKLIVCSQNHHFSRSNALRNPPPTASFRVGLKHHDVHWCTAGCSHFRRGRVALGHERLEVPWNSTIFQNCSGVFERIRLISESRSVKILVAYGVISCSSHGLLCVCDFICRCENVVRIYGAFYQQVHAALLNPIDLSR
jgi:hypothetical protein